MRNKNHTKTSKSTYRQKIRKKRHKSRSNIGCTPNVSNLNLENINEVFRANRAYFKNQQSEGKGAWKVVPKDSCEVYKDRRKRQENSRRDEDSAEMETESEDTADPRPPQRQDERKYGKGAVGKTRRKRRPRRRSEENSSLSSYTTTNTSDLSSSEMDY